MRSLALIAYRHKHCKHQLFTFCADAKAQQPACAGKAARGGRNAPCGLAGIIARTHKVPCLKSLQAQALTSTNFLHYVLMQRLNRLHALQRQQEEAGTLRAGLAAIIARTHKVPRLKSLQAQALTSINFLHYVLMQRLNSLHALQRQQEEAGILRAGLAAIIAHTLLFNLFTFGSGKGSTACVRCKGSKRRQERSLQGSLLS